MRIFISTGEVSGDLQAALLIKSLLNLAEIRGIDLEIVGLGGDRMKQAGANILANTTSIGSVGLLESIPFILPTLKIQKFAKQYLTENAVDLLLLIDYPGPNISIGTYVKKQFPKLPIIYYIAPQNWVWTPTESATKQVVKISDKILAIFAEEARYFQGKGAEVTWVGHPLLDRMKTTLNRDQARKKLGIKPEQKIVTILPASRQQEIKYMLPIMLETAQKIQAKISEVRFYIPLSLPIYRTAINRAIKQYNIKATIVENEPLEAIAAADLAITKSGTVNLEIALLNVPQVVIYKVAPLTMFVARKIFNFNISFMSPVNLVMQREIVPELLQEQATVDNIFQKAIALLTDQNKRQEIEHNYQEMRQKMGSENVSDRTADAILNYLIE
jgi:lipid-A-disaccharide synthase